MVFQNALGDQQRTVSSAAARGVHRRRWVHHDCNQYDRVMAEQLRTVVLVEPVRTYRNG
jgi:hypothetical protein